MKMHVSQYFHHFNRIILDILFWDHKCRQFSRWWTKMQRLWFFRTRQLVSEFKVWEELWPNICNFSNDDIGYCFLQTPTHLFINKVEAKVIVALFDSLWILIMYYSLRARLRFTLFHFGSSPIKSHTSFLL